MNADGNPGSGTPSGSAPPAEERGSGTPDRPRRWVRRLLVLAAALFLLGGASAFFLRLHVLEWILTQRLPEALTEVAGAPVDVGSIQVREVEDEESGLRIEIAGLAGPGSESRPGFSAEGLEIRLRGWWQLAEGLGAITRVRVRELSVELPSPPRAPRGSALDDAPPREWWARLLTWVAPEELPTLPFAIELEKARITWADKAIEARVETEGEHAEIHLEPLPWVPSVDRAVVELRIAGDGRFLSWSVARPTGEAISGGRAERSGEHWEIRAWGALLGAEGEITGRIPVVPDAELEGEIEARCDDPSRMAEALGIDPSLVPGPIGLTVVAERTETGARATGEVDVPGGELRGSAELGPQELDVELNANRFTAGIWLSRFWPEGEVVLPVSGDIRISGPYEDPELVASVQVSSGRVTVAGERVDLAELSGRARATRRGVEVLSLDATVFSGRVEGGGFFGRDGRITADLAFSRIDLEPLEVWAPGLRAVEGRIDGRGTLTGRLGAPAEEFQWQLDGRLTEGAVAIESWERIQELSLDYHLTGERLQVSAVDGRLGSGSLKGGGWLEGITGAEPRFSFSLELDRVLLYRSPALFARGSGGIELSGTPETPRLLGELEVTRGLYRENFYPSLERGTGLPFRLFSIEEGFASRLDFDVGISLTGGFRVANNRLEVAPHGELRLRGSGQRPFVTGSITATEGFLTLPQVRLGIEQAEVSFPENDPFKPRLEFLGTGTIGSYEIESRATGTLENPEVTFSSTPSLPQEDLLALLVTGKVTDRLRDEGVETVAAIEILKLYGPRVWERIFGRSTGESYVRTVNISRTPPQTQTGSESYRVEILLRNNFGVVAENNERGDVTVDVLYFIWMP